MYWRTVYTIKLHHKVNIIFIWIIYVYDAILLLRLTGAMLDDGSPPAATAANIACVHILLPALCTETCFNEGNLWKSCCYRRLMHVIQESFAFWKYMSILTLTTLQASILYMVAHQNPAEKNILVLLTNSVSNIQ